MMKLKKMYVLFAGIVLITICFSSCGKEQYAEDGLYRDCACGYLVSEKQVGFFGTTLPEYFMIYFDEDGFAHWCRYEQVD